ncbi:GNAT family protein [Deinococcus sp.]|uniref:GNAT family N-acetyltransferase n=1 Tax=Deinococcus sp. TaxID=47478 RepID=UPI0025C4FFF9|nr:GNAT family protein [Deinococcus sp.]
MSVSLRSLCPGDENYAAQWGQDREFCLSNGWEPGLPAGRIQAHWRGLITAPPSQFLRLGIVHNGVLVGYTDLADLVAVSGELGVAIGESRLWGQGLGTAAGQLMLRHAFGVLRLERVWAEVHEPNRRSHALMQRLGFVEIGREGTDLYRGQTVGLVQYKLNRPTGDQ